MSSFMERLSKADQIFRIEILEFTWQSNNKTVIVRSGDKGKSLYARFTLRFFGSLTGSCQKQEKRKLTLADKTDLSFPFVKGAESNISFSHNIVKPSKLCVHSCNKPFVKALKIHRGKIPLLYCALLFPCGIISQPNNPTMESKIL